MAHSLDLIIPCILSPHTEPNSIFLPYIPDYMEIVNVLPNYKEPNKYNSCCYQWQIYIKDIYNRGPSLQLQNSLYQYLNLYKPRNTDEVTLSFHANLVIGSVWSVVYSVHWCTCQTQLPQSTSKKPVDYEGTHDMFAKLKISKDKDILK